jgi:hypothetical protein
MDFFDLVQLNFSMISTGYCQQQTSALTISLVCAKTTKACAEQSALTSVRSVECGLFA